MNSYPMKKSIRANTEGVPKQWGIKSVTYWLGLLSALGLIALGVNGLIQPMAASNAFGLGIVHPQDAGYVRVKAVRDLVLGLTIGVFLLLKWKQALMMLALTSAIIPMLDGILVLTQPGGEFSYSWQHFITMAFVLLVAFLLWRETRHQTPER